MDDFLLRSAATALSILGVLLIPFGLPGNWVIAASGLLGLSLGLGWAPFLILLVAAAVAEILEFQTTMRYTKKSGAGKSGIWGAFVGGFFGAILGTPIFPVVGTLLGAAVGAFAGAALFEVIFGDRSGKEGVRVGKGAFWGALFGKVMKMGLGIFQAFWWTAHLWGLL
jgi:uncharacterized protein YqgC (DUF456 family)